MGAVAGAPVRVLPWASVSMETAWSGGELHPRLEAGLCGDWAPDAMPSLVFLPLLLSLHFSELAGLGTAATAQASLGELQAGMGRVPQCNLPPPASAWSWLLQVVGCGVTPLAPLISASLGFSPQAGGRGREDSS